jgi:hypothetical protein
MKTINIKRIGFGSYLKLHIVISISIGIIFGLLFLVFGILGGPVTANFGEARYTGMTAGIIGFFVAPLTLLITGLVFSLLTFLPLKALLYFTKGLKLHGEFETLYDNDDIYDEKQADDGAALNKGMATESDGVEDESGRSKNN